MKVNHYSIANYNNEHDKPLYSATTHYLSIYTTRTILLWDA